MTTDVKQKKRGDSNGLFCCFFKAKRLIERQTNRCKKDSPMVNTKIYSINNYIRVIIKKIIKKIISLALCATMLFSVANIASSALTQSEIATKNEAEIKNVIENFFSEYEEKFNTEDTLSAF